MCWDMKVRGEPFQHLYKVKHNAWLPFRARSYQDRLEGGESLKYLWWWSDLFWWRVGVVWFPGGIPEEAMWARAFGDIHVRFFSVFNKLEKMLWFFALLLRGGRAQKLRNLWRSNVIDAVKILNALQHALWHNSLVPKRCMRQIKATKYPALRDTILQTPGSKRLWLVVKHLLEVESFLVDLSIFWPWLRVCETHLNLEARCATINSINYLFLR